MNEPLFANQRLRIRPNICKLVKRTLKGPGQILVQKNTEILPHDIIGRYTLTPGFTKVNLSKELNVSPQEAPQFLKKAVGQKIFKGELLALKKSLFGSSEIVAPTDAIFESLDGQTGEATLKLIPKEVALTSGVFGQVMEIDAARGEVVIKCMTSEIYGIFGTGIEKEGFINVIAGAGDLVNASKITSENHGQILVAGALVLDETIKQALTCNASGIICGGLNITEYLSMAASLSPGKQIGTEIGISIIATEGFGLLPIGDDLFDLFKKNDSHFAMINGNLSRLLLPSDDPDSILSCRKVGLPEKQAHGVKPELSVSEIKIGLKVRLIWPPFMGSQGTISQIDNTPTKLPSGIPTYMLTVETKSRKIRVPYVNVEII